MSFPVRLNRRDGPCCRQKKYAPGGFWPAGARRQVARSKELPRAQDMRADLTAAEQNYHKNRKRDAVRDLVADCLVSDRKRWHKSEIKESQYEMATHAAAFFAGE